jgi:hypothetical protein
MTVLSAPSPYHFVSTFSAKWKLNGVDTIAGPDLCEQTFRMIRQFRRFVKVGRDILQ